MNPSSDLERCRELLGELGWPWAAERLTTPPEDAKSLQRLLAPAADGTLSKTPVSRRVNSPKHDDAACLEREMGTLWE